MTEINGKPTAKIMFLNGMSRFKESGDISYLHNDYLFENLALTLQMKLAAEAYYPDLHDEITLMHMNITLECADSVCLLKLALRQIHSGGRKCSRTSCCTDR